jgi:hypothetical protein
MKQKQQGACHALLSPVLAEARHAAPGVPPLLHRPPRAQQPVPRAAVPASARSPVPVLTEEACHTATQPLHLRFWWHQQAPRPTRSAAQQPVLHAVRAQHFLVYEAT